MLGSRSRMLESTVFKYVCSISLEHTESACIRSRHAIMSQLYVVISANRILMFGVNSDPFSPITLAFPANLILTSKPNPEHSAITSFTVKHAIPAESGHIRSCHAIRCRNTVTKFLKILFWHLDIILDIFPHHTFSLKNKHSREKPFVTLS